MASVVLRVNGREYSGWKSARFTRGIEAVSGGFDLEITDRWSGQDRPWPILEEDECSLLVGGEGVISGFVDKRSLSYGPTEHRLSVSGRDRAAALVDCSAMPRQWEFRNVPLLTLARRLAEPFGIAVGLQPGLELPPVAKLSVDPGDTAFDALERACRMIGVLPISDGAGNVVLARAGASRAATELVEGENIRAAGADFDASGRFRRYIVAGQHAGADSLFGESAARVRAEAQDDAVRRAERVLLVRAESNATAANAKQRAAWEAKVRAGRAAGVTVTVQGWQQGDGRLWPVNAVVRVRSPWLGIDADLLITEATYSLDESGTTTSLALKRADAFLPEPVVKPTGTGGRWGALLGDATAPATSSEDDLMCAWDPGAPR